MAGLTGKATRRGTTEGVGRATESERRDTNTNLPGEIVDYDPVTQLATVRIMYKPTVNGTPVEPPLLKKVPVRQTRGGGFSMTVAIKTGDTVNLSFDGVDTSEFQTTGRQMPGITKRLNSLSDATATPDRVASTRALERMDAVNMHLGTEDGLSGVRVSPAGLLALEGPGGSQDMVVILSELLGILLDETTTVKSGSSKGTHPLTNQSAFAALKARLDSMKLN